MTVYTLFRERSLGTFSWDLIAPEPPTGPVSVSPLLPVGATEFDLSPALRSKKESFLLMSAVRHMQCRGGGRRWGSEGW